MMQKGIIGIFVLALLFGCAIDDDPKLPSVEERVSEAIGSLQDALEDPANGWQLAYRPTNETGAFLILMDFNPDGTVRIQSDVSANGGEFRDHVVSYRIESSQGIELILETYGVFHYLFELEQNSFGAEFEFEFVEEQGSDLVFRSKSDGGFDITTLVFEEAGPTAANSITEDALNFLRQGIFHTDNLGNTGGVGHFNFYIPSTNHTISATFDLGRRVVKFIGIAEGADEASIIATNSIQTLDLETPFSLFNESVVLDESQVITFAGSTYTINQIPIGNFSTSQSSFCAGEQETIVNLSGTAGFGSFTATSSLFQSSNSFQPDPSGVYGVNPFFVYDENDSSILEDIQVVFPDVVAFQVYYGLALADSVFNGVGFVTLDEFNNADFYLRGFDVTQTGNFFQLTFNNNNLITNDDATAEELAGLDQLTDLIFSGGNFYVLEIVNQGGLFEFYNPCNKYKGFLL